jgi:arylsulfatase A-like enzyme
MQAPAMPRRRFLRRIAGAGAAAVAPRLLGAADRASATGKPNIVFIFADDMGYGDPRCYNPDSKIPTPNIDSLARDGMRFTDAHAPVGLCVPSRYGLLTGRYPFRWPKKGPRIRKERTTIASLLRNAGYRTAMVGKWHLGYRRGLHKKPVAGETLVGGPVDRGFDSFFGIHASLDIPPYYYIEGNQFVQVPTQTVEASRSPGWSRIQGAFWRAGKIAPNFKHREVLPRFTERAVQDITTHRRTRPDQPLFLYFALAAPHTPWLPDQRFKGKSGAAMYGDFVAQVDHCVGRVLETLDELGMADDTLVVFSSDNGPVWFPKDVERLGHSSAGPLRGMKADAWEGGNRMPFIVRWPGKVKPGTVSDELICFTDVIATFADAVGAELPETEAEDSVSFLPVLRGRPERRVARKALLLRSGRGMWAVRAGRWKLILGRGSGGFSKPARLKPQPGKPKGQLYDLQADIGETHNLYDEHPDIVRRLTDLMEAIRKDGRAALATPARRLRQVDG